MGDPYIDYFDGLVLRSPLVLLGLVALTLWLAPQGRRWGYFFKAALGAILAVPISLFLPLPEMRTSAIFGILFLFYLIFWATVGFGITWAVMFLRSGSDRKWVSVPLLATVALLVGVWMLRNAAVQRNVADVKFWRSHLKDSESIPLAEMQHHLSADGRHIAGLMIEGDKDRQIGTETLEALRVVGLGESVARNPSISEATCYALYNDGLNAWPNYELLRGLARNPAVPKSLMMILIEHPNGGVLQELAMNPAADPEILAALTVRAQTIIEQQRKTSNPTSEWDAIKAREVLTRISLRGRVASPAP